MGKTQQPCTTQTKRLADDLFSICVQ
ncbi:Protein of unknown function [Escherichia coli D6-113.11]|nr:Protein of unknown function [Escherichia coli D6-113.11]CDU34166.1 Protein of unknown function [Escherichia coli D6-113.11]